ncbi:aldose 1-epimerase [Curvivirga sp.]|uniref:aldose 1-epimerase n=1 Tax=Curvivirga sp. TaxID=2856848 RepID=UPI003B5BE1CE
MNETIEISRGPFKATISPPLGGSLLSFTEDLDVGTHHHLRPAPIGTNDVLQSACYPLVPFSNRVLNASFNWEGEQINLNPNFAPEPHMIHGHGWQNPWQITEIQPNQACLSYRHQANNWPWSYEALLSYSLSVHGLTIQLSITNLSEENMPAGIGLHPFFPKQEQTIVITDVEAIQLNDTNKHPVRIDKTHYALKQLQYGTSFPMGLDNCFINWSGHATIQNNRKLEISTSEIFSHMVLYTPNGQNFFCLEPVSHLNSALNLKKNNCFEAGIIVLKPGETLSGNLSLLSIS